MDKGFGFQPRNCGNFPYLIQSQLPGQHDAAETNFLQRQRAFFVMYGHLRAGMQFQLRISLAHDARHAQILHDQRVNLIFGAQVKRLQQFRQLVLLKQRIDRNINLSPQRMSITDKLVQIVGAEIGGRRPRRKML